MNITICGGGNLGHVCAGFLAAQADNKVNMLTSSPERWSHHIEVADCKGKTFHGVLDRVSSSPSEVIPQADLVLICLPGFAIHDVLTNIRPYLSPTAMVGTVVASTGFFFEALKILPATQPLFGFQRVPFIARTKRYGQSAELKGYKDSLSVAIENTTRKDEIRAMLEQLFQTPVKLLGSYYEVSLSNSNPLLHTSRLYTMWKDWQPGMSYDHVPMFYADWTQEAAELYIAMDEEFQQLLRAIGVPKESIPPVLDYYECRDAYSLMMKIRSIPAFQGIPAPMVVNMFGQYEPDFSSRYFTEDFPYGMKYILDIADREHLSLPKITKVYNWYREIR